MFARVTSMLLLRFRSLSDLHSSGTGVYGVQVYLITVSVGLERTFNWNTDVFGLLLGQDGELGSKGTKVKFGNLLVKDLGKDVDLSGFVLASVSFLVDLQLSKNLVGERARHDERWVTSGTSQVEKTSLSKNNDTVSRWEGELVDLGLDVHALGGLHESIHVDFVVEVTNVSDDGVVLHLGHVLGHEDTLVTSGGDEDISNLDNIFQSADSVSFHAGLKGADGVDFGDVDNASVGLHGMGATLTDISVSADDGLLSGKHDIGGTHDTIGKRVLASVQVIELGLGDGVVDVEGGEKKRSGLFHGVQTVDTSGGLFGDTVASGGNLVPLVGLTSFQKTLEDAKNNLEFGVVSGGRVGKSLVLGVKVFGLLSLVDDEGHVTTVINNKIGSVALAIILLPGEGVQGALPVFLKGFSLPCENSGRFVTGDSSGGVILGGEDVARAPTDVSTKLLEGLDKDGSLDGHVEGSRDTGTLQWLFSSEFSTASHKSRHLDLGKLNVLATVVGERNISN